MRIDCPNCGRVGRLPEGRELPAAVRCPGCKQIFSTESVAVERTLPGQVRRTPTPAPEAGLVRRGETPMRPVAQPERVARVPVRVEPQVIEVGLTSSVPARTCDYCGESIQPSARKCRHCGELLDPALRAAEEAKRIALATSSSTPIVISNNIANSAVAVSGGLARRRSLMARLARLVAVGLVLTIVGSILVATATEQAGSRVVLGGGMVVVGIAMLIIGVPFLLVVGCWKALFG